MKAVMRELAQAKRHYSTLPLFAFLRDEAAARSPGVRSLHGNELAAYAKHALAQRNAPHMIQASATLRSAP